MPLETATYVANLIESNPDGGDQRTTADDHLRLLKAVMKRTFPSADRPYPTPVQVSYVADLSLSAQAQLNALRDAPDKAKKATQADSATTAANATNASIAGAITMSDRVGNAQAWVGVVGLTAVVRDQNGDIYARYLYSGAPNDENSPVGQLLTTTGNDGYMRKVGMSNFFAQLASLSVALNGGGFNATYVSGQSLADLRNASFLTGSIPAGVVPLAAVSQHAANLKTRNISNKTGTAVTLSSSAPSGGADGDIWLRI